MTMKAWIWPTWGGRTQALRKRAGLTGFVFFLVKGILWLVMPIVLYVFSGH